MAQQIKDEDGYWTFRKWNPFMKNVPVGETTKPISAPEQVPMWFVCRIIDKCMNLMFDEVIDYAVDGLYSPETFFEE